MKRAKSLLLRLLALCLILCCVLPVTALAMPLQTAAPMSSSKYLLPCAATLNDEGDYNFKLTFTIRANQTMDTLGVRSVRIYESADKVNWVPIKTFASTDYPSMMGSNTFVHRDSLTFDGKAGKYYKAYLSVYTTLGSDSESTFFFANWP